MSLLLLKLFSIMFSAVQGFPKKHLIPSESAPVSSSCIALPSPPWVTGLFHTLHLQMLIQPHSRYALTKFYLFPSRWERGERWRKIHIDIFGYMNLLFHCFWFFSLVQIQGLPRCTLLHLYWANRFRSCLSGLQRASYGSVFSHDINASFIF